MIKKFIQIKKTKNEAKIFVLIFNLINNLNK